MFFKCLAFVTTPLMHTSKIKKGKNTNDDKVSIINYKYVR
jgi:hypothetical protein